MMKVEVSDAPSQIVVIFPAGLIDTVPSVMAAIREFRALGHRVAVFCETQEGYLRPPIFSGQEEYYWRVPRRQISNPLCFLANRFAWRTWLLAQLRYGPTACVVGVDSRGLIIAAWLARWLRAPLVYWSLEIMVPSELRKMEDRLRKYREQKAARGVSLLIIQDEEREDLLRESLDLPQARTFLVPNAPGGSAERRRSKFLHQRLGISENKRIVLHSGSVAAWACCTQLADSTADWPKDWVLVFHSRKALADDPYAALLRMSSPPGRVYLSETPVPSDSFWEVVRSADVGVALYCEKADSPYTQKNLRYIGLSSGKAAHYLREGVPLIYNSAGLFDSVMQRYRCGERVEDPRHTVAAIFNLFSNYDKCCTAAVQCFNERLRVDGRFASMLSVLTDARAMNRYAQPNAGE